MTRSRLARLRKLEAGRVEVGDVLGFFYADLGAGVWKEDGGQGRTLPMTPEEAADVEACGGAALMLAPVGPPKMLAGLRPGDL